MSLTDKSYHFGSFLFCSGLIPNGIGESRIVADGESAAPLASIVRASASVAGDKKEKRKRKRDKKSK